MDHRPQVRQLPCKMTEQERLLKSDELAKKVAELPRLEREKKAWNADWKERKETLETQAQELAHEIESGEEMRPIECHDYADYVRCMVNTIRSDTGEVVHSRPMHPDERQTSLLEGNRQSIEDEAH